MAEGGSNSVAIVVVLVIVMMAGTLTMFAFSLVLDDSDEDPYEQPREYTVSGTIDGVEYTGTGLCTYAEESTLYYTYYFTLTLEAADGSSESWSFGAIFESDALPADDLYDYVGEGEYAGESVSVWYVLDYGTGYTIYVAEYCTVVYAEIASDSVSLVMEIVSD